MNSRNLSTILQLIIAGALVAIVVLLFPISKNLAHPKPVNWGYKTMAFSDDWPDMKKYLADEQKKKPAGATEYYDSIQMLEKSTAGEFGSLSIDPGDGWELCAHFLEPRASHPRLICIFKKPYP